jgi:hypothetical protein
MPGSEQWLVHVQRRKQVLTLSCFWRPGAAFYISETGIRFIVDKETICRLP